MYRSLFAFLLSLFPVPPQIADRKRIMVAGLVPNTLQRQRTGDHKGPPPRILTPLAPTIRRIGPPRPCIVGAGEDVDRGRGPLNPVWGTGIAARPYPPPHILSSPYLQCIGACPF